MSTHIEDIIILTKSFKNRKFCVAGINADTGEWIRLVTNDEASRGALSNADMTCLDGSISQPLDIVRVPICREVGTPHQPENVLIAAGKRWAKLGQSTLADVLRLCPASRSSYVFGTQSYKLLEEELPGYSLDLIRVTNLTVFQEGRLKSDFTYNGRAYRYVSFTDPEYAQVNGKANLGDAYLVVSLPEVPHTDGYYYKFVAKAFPTGT